MKIKFLEIAQVELDDAIEYYNYESPGVGDACLTVQYYGIKIEGLKMEEKQDKRLKELISLAMECMGVAVTIIDMKGTLLYCNRQAAKILDRKSEYIGKDIHSYHKKANSNKKLDLMLQDFQKGRTEPFHYEAKPYGLSTQPAPVNLINIDTIQSKRIIEFHLVHTN